MHHPKVDYRETLVTYLNSESMAHAAQNLNITKGALAARIKVMRKAGVKVPTIIGPRTGLDSLMVAQLNSIISKHKKARSN